MAFQTGQNYIDKKILSRQHHQTHRDHESTYRQPSQYCCSPCDQQTTSICPT